MKEMVSLKNKPHGRRGGKENLSKSQVNLPVNPERTFGEDITKKFDNSKYNCMLSKERHILKLPSFLRQRDLVGSALKPYEEKIIEHMVSSHEEYDLTRKSKGSVLKNAKRIKIMEYFNVMGLKYRLRKKTVYMSAYLYDKYMEKYGTSLGADYANIAQSCMLIAMKYEEIYPPLLRDWC